MISMIHGDQVMMLMAAEFEKRYHVISVNADYDCITRTWPKCGNIKPVSHPWVISKFFAPSLSSRFIPKEYLPLSLQFKTHRNENVLIP